MSATVRGFRDDDIEALTQLYNWYILETTITFDLRSYTPEQRRERWLSHYDSTGRHQLLVAEINEQVVGYASSSQLRIKAAYDPSVEASIYLAKDFQRLGIGSLLYDRLFEKLEKEDVHRVYAGITLPNEASLAFHRKFGFDEVGRFHEVGRKFGKFWDVAWMEKRMA